jgi:adenylate kinase
MRIVLMGPPGAGKGTQAQAVSNSLGIPHISTGEIFRAQMAKGSKLGLEAKTFMDRGEYVPDSVTNAIVDDRLNQSDAKDGFLLDGYPRTADQVEELTGMLSAQELALDCAVEITADTDEVVGRLLKRAELESRPDDTEEVIRHRMEVYAEQTEPLTSMYQAQGLLVRVDGMGSVDEVTDRLLAALKS